MPQIEIDFEVFKELTARRPTEEVTCNDVVRGLLKLQPAPKARSLSQPASSPKAGRPWLVSGTSFPVGSEFLAEHKGKRHTGVVKDGRLVLEDGSAFTTPSAAAVYVTGNNVNGWRFWKCRLPGATEFVLVERLRGKVH